MRLLFCNACKTLEELPDFEGKTDPDHPDLFVQELLEKHTKRDPMAHGGAKLQYSPFRLFGDITEKTWKDEQYRKKIIDLINAENKKVGFDAWVHESMNTYSDDAVRCYREHHRPTLPGRECHDFWSESKRIGRPTEEGRAVIKDSYKLGDQDPHLCQFCPYFSYVQTEIRAKEGLYKP